LLLACSRLRPSATYHTLRLEPKQNLKKELQLYLEKNKIEAAAIVTAVGSLSRLHIRKANQKKYSSESDYFEIVSLVGTLSYPHGMHLHISASNSKGQTLGGHLGNGSIVYTTVEIVLVELTDKAFKREHCPLSGFKELKVYEKN